MMKFQLIGRHRVAVPTHFFKIVSSRGAVKAGGEGDAPRVIAFLLPNAPASPKELSEHITTVDLIEEQTGLDFFNALDDDLEEPLEGRKAVGLDSWLPRPAPPARPLLPFRPAPQALRGGVPVLPARGLEDPLGLRNPRGALRRGTAGRGQRRPPPADRRRRAPPPPDRPALPAPSDLLGAGGAGPRARCPGRARGRGAAQRRAHPALRGAPPRPGPGPAPARPAHPAPADRAHGLAGVDADRGTQPPGAAHDRGRGAPDPEARAGGDRGIDAAGA